MATSQPILTFDGNDDYVELPITSVPEGNEITISFWAKGGSKQPKNNSIFYAGTPSKLDLRIINIHLPWGGDVCWDCGSNGSVHNRIVKKAENSDIKGQWIHWAFTLNASTGKMKIYRNGGDLWQEQASDDKTHPIPKVGNVKLGSGYAFYNGSISDVRVWNRALEPAKIKATMSNRLTGKEPGLVSYWPLDEGNGNQVLDKTDNGNNGTIHGATWETTKELEFTPIKSPESAATNTKDVDTAAAKRSTSTSDRNKPAPTASRPANATQTPTNTITTMKLPKLSPPVHRPHFIEPALAVDVEHGRVEDLVNIRMDLLHGANYNDPAAFAPFSYGRVMHSAYGGCGSWR